MKERSGDGLEWIVAAWVALFCLVLPQTVWSSNQAGGAHMIGSAPDEIRFAVRLDNRPDFSLKPAPGDGLVLTLHDTRKARQMKMPMENPQGPPEWSVDEQQGSLLFRLRLKSTPRAVSCSWLNSEKMFLLETGGGSKAENIASTDKTPNVLKGLLFGEQDTATRMVLAVDHRPRWEVGFKGNEGLALTLEAVPKTLYRKKYGPLKRIKQAVLSNTDQNTRISIAPEAPFSHLSITWHEELRRLTMDLYDEADASKDPDFLKGVFTAAAEEPRETSQERHDTGQHASLKQDSKDEATLQKTLPAPDQGKKENNPPLAEQKKVVSASPAEEVQINEPPDLATAPSLQEKGYFVRKKIPRKSGAKPPLPEQAPAAAPPPIDIHPEMELTPDGYLPGRSEIEAWSNQLTTEEAFLFGKIQEAWESKDYEKGAALIDQFTLKYPDSPLAERVAFVRGDFLLYLLQSGRRDILPALMDSYQDAMARHKNSASVPGALIKMAQANAFVDNFYASLGYLNTALIKYPQGNHVPRAYITRGKVYLLMNQYEKAMDDFKSILDRFPQSDLINEARYWIATYFHNKGIYEEAERFLKDIEIADPLFHLQHPEYLFLCARNFSYQKKYDPARDFYLKALNIGKQPEGNDIILSHIGDTYHHQSQEDDARKFYEAAIEQYPESEGAAVAKLRLAKYTSGVSGIQEVHARNINKPIGDLALLEMANKYIEEGQYTAAMEQVKPLMNKPTYNSMNQEAKRLFYRSAEMEIRRHYESGDYSKVIQFFQNTETKLKDAIHPENQLMVAESYQKNGQSREAIASYLKINMVDLNARSRGNYILRLAESYVMAGEEDKAIGLLEKNNGDVIGLEHQQRASLMLASIFKNRGELQKSYHLFRSVVEAEKRLPDLDIARAYLEMGEISNIEKRYTDARKALNRSIDLAGKETQGRDCLGQAFAELGNTNYFEKHHKQAIEEYEKGFELGYVSNDSGFWEKRFRLALCYLALEENVKAQQILNQISEEGDPVLQQRVQIKLGVMDLENQLKRLPIWEEMRKGS